MSSTQLQNRSFPVAERDENVRRCTKTKNALPENYCFSLSNMQICFVLVAVVARAARAARLFFFYQPIKSLICGVVVAADVVIS